MHRLTLRQRLVLMVLVPAVLLAAGLSSFLLRHSNAQADAALHERAQAIVSFLAPAAEYGVISGNVYALQSLLEAVLEQRDVAAASILDSDGVVLASSGRHGFDTRSLAEPDRPAAPHTMSLDGRVAGLAPVSLAPARFDESSPPSPIERALIVGWVHVELDTAALAAHKQEMLNTTLAITSSVIFLTLLLALGLSGAVSRPLSRLADAVRDMSEGRLDTRVSANADLIELRTLQKGFNNMASAIANSQHTMQQRIDEATHQLAYQATHDPLTKLPNRRAFEQALEDAVMASRRAADASVLCFLDLDRFKIVNDTAGHAAGDALLARIAELIRHRVRSGDLLCRIGGDEFGLILRGCSMDEAHHVAEGLIQAVANDRFEWGDQNFTVGVSIGLVALDGRLTSSGDALVAADLACYTAKRKGRNTISAHGTLPDPTEGPEAK